MEKMYKQEEKEVLAVESNVLSRLSLVYYKNKQKTQNKPIKKFISAISFG